MLQFVSLQFQLAGGALELLPILRQHSVTGMATHCLR